jgi:hypothetical protein
VQHALCLDYGDGKLQELEQRTLVSKVTEIIRAFRPDVVRTFGEDGVYGHPDHIAVGAATDTACTLAGDPTRALVPLADVDAVLPVKPTYCSRCQHPLHGEDGQPQRHQVTELPPVQPVVTEYQLHSLVCSACGATTRAALLLGVPSRGFGPRVRAIVALCTGVYHLSKRTTQDVLEDLVGIAMSLGTITHLEQATVQAMATPVAAARTYVRM